MTIDLFDGQQLAPDAPRGLGRAMVGDGKRKRRARDYYPTPTEATRALLIAERPYWGEAAACGPAFWEPCGRGGAIARVALDEFGLTSIATDIVGDPAHDVDEQDLLAVRTAPASRVVSNLPFALARPMVAHLWGVLQLDYMALLFKTTFLNCGESAALWRAGLAPNRRWDCTWRIDFTDEGNPTMDCTWLVWDRLHAGQRFGLLDRGGPVAVEGLF
jgi:hypothetical protein